MTASVEMAGAMACTYVHVDLGIYEFKLLEVENRTAKENQECCAFSKVRM